MVAFLYCHSYPQVFCIIRLTNTNNWRKCWFSQYLIPCSHKVSLVDMQWLEDICIHGMPHGRSRYHDLPLSVSQGRTDCSVSCGRAQTGQAVERVGSKISSVFEWTKGPLHFIMYLNLGEITTDSWGNLKEVSSTHMNSAWWIVHKTSQNRIIWANLHENEW